MRRLLYIFFLAAALCALFTTPALALEYTIDQPEDYLFGRPTSEDTPDQAEDPNVDRSKSTALIPPRFGTPTSYLPGSGEYLTPNLVPGALSGGLVNQVGGSAGLSVEAGGGGYPAVDTSITPDYPAVNAGPSPSVTTVSFTEVTSSLYYTNGSLGVLKIPSIGLTVSVYEGTGSAPLLKGAGHFEGTSILDGNVPIAGHNRGVRNDLGKIHTLGVGERIIFTTALGTRTYAVSSVTKVDVTDTSGLSATAENCITLYTCVEDQPAYRWCVKGVEVM